MIAVYVNDEHSNDLFISLAVGWKLNRRQEYYYLLKAQKRSRNSVRFAFHEKS